MTDQQPTPEDLERMAAEMRTRAAQVGQPQTPRRMRFRMFSGPISEAETVGNLVDEYIGESQDKGGKCMEPLIRVDHGLVLVAVTMGEPGETNT